MQASKLVTKPRKQRKRIYKAPSHLRYKFFSATLSPRLRGAHGINALPVRSGDTIRIMRGDHKGFEGKISRIDRKKFRIYVEGLSHEKVEGTTKLLPMHPSKVMITRFNLDDKWRKKILERKKKGKKMKEEEEVIEERTTEKKKPFKKEGERRRKSAPRKTKERSGETKKEQRLNEKRVKRKVRKDGS